MVEEVHITPSQSPRQGTHEGEHNAHRPEGTPARIRYHVAQNLGTPDKRTRGQRKRRFQCGNVSGMPGVPQKSARHGTRRQKQTRQGVTRSRRETSRITGTTMKYCCWGNLFVECGRVLVHVQLTDMSAGSM